MSLTPAHQARMLARTWRERPELLRLYVERRDRYERLVDAVSETLRRRLEERAIDVAWVVGRAKSLHSFAEKIERKRYRRPLEEMTDLAGVRIVYLYRTDLDAILKVIAADFRIIERIDKTKELKSNRFGYAAVHYVVRLGSEFRGARYDDLSGLNCEIQVRTVLQDAWAILEHHLNYKQHVPLGDAAIRRLSALAAMLESGDDTCVQIRHEQLKPQSSGRRRRTNAHPPSRELDAATLESLLKRSYPGRPSTAVSGQFGLAARGESLHNTQSDAAFVTACV